MLPQAPARPEGRGVLFTSGAAPFPGVTARPALTPGRAGAQNSSSPRGDRRRTLEGSGEAATAWASRDPEPVAGGALASPGEWLIEEHRRTVARPIRNLKRVLGGALLVFALFPVYGALDTSGDAPFRRASVEIAGATLQFAWWGTLLVLLLAVLLALLFSDLMVRFGRSAGAALSRPSLPIFSVTVGLVAFGLSLGVGELLYQGLYTNMDEIASAVHARYMALGSLAGPALPFPEAWLVTNTLMADSGWVSQYPPSHLAIMALFYRLGIPRLTGPILMGIMAWLLALSFERLLPRHRAVARAGALLTAVSPFLLFLAGGALSHLSAGAAGAAILYASLRARDGRPYWGLLVGAAIGVMVSSRPLIGLVLGTAFPLSIWGADLMGGRIRAVAARTGTMILGGIPFAISLALYNQRLFGAPTRFGYLAAFGNNHRLGFHLDPWGYLYGIESAVAFTSIDLLAVGVQYLETPLPLTVAVGAYLLLGPGLPKGVGTVLAWALLPLAANAFYWFHDPRMMFEAAPAWILLAVLGVGEIITRGVARGGRWNRVAEVTSWAVAVSILLAVGWSVPSRWGNYSWISATLERIQAPSLPTEELALVFVHTSWNERLSANLQGGGGMRQDSIVSALRRNTNCALQRYARAREEEGAGGEQGAGWPEVDLEQASDSPPGLVHTTLPSGVSVRFREGEEMTSECLREIRADRFGAVALAPLLWQGDLPGDERGAPMFVRDFGPERNGRIRALFPEREAFLFTPVEEGGAPRVIPFQEGMALLWSAPPGGEAVEVGGNGKQGPEA